jgi:hypothetical protein
MQDHSYGEMQLPNLRTTVFADVRYEVINRQVVKKTIQLRQADMFVLLYELPIAWSPRLRPQSSGALTIPIAKADRCTNTFLLRASAHRAA